MRGSSPAASEEHSGSPRSAMLPPPAPYLAGISSTPLVQPLNDTSVSTAASTPPITPQLSQQPTPTGTASTAVTCPSSASKARPSAAVVAVVRPDMKASPGELPTLDLHHQEQLLQRDRINDQLRKELASQTEESTRLRTRCQRANNSSDCVMEGLLQLVAQNEQLRGEQRRASVAAAAERDEAGEELTRMETLFSDINRKFEKSRMMLVKSDQSAELLNAQLQETQAALHTERQRYQILQQHSEDTFQSLRADKEQLVQAVEREKLRMSTKLRLSENRESKLQQENAELTALCDELLQKMGSSN